MAQRRLRPLDVDYNEDGSATYRTLAGDTVGNLACRHYGHEWDTTELVLDRNPGLGGLGPLLPAGVVVLFPALTAEQLAGATKTQTVNLYD